MKEQQSNKKLLIEYAGLAMQLLVSLGIAVYAGLKLDEWMDTSFPLLVWLLPLIVLIAMIVKAVKDTSKK